MNGLVRPDDRVARFVATLGGALRDGQFANPVTSMHEVVCVCGGFGFPYGASGSTSRIIMVGKALHAAGIAFRVIHCGPSPLTVNSQRAGVHENIAYEYTTSVERPSNAVARKLTYLRALVGVAIRLIRLRAVRRHTAIWLYIDGPANLLVSSVCRLLGLSVVQELCEWWSDPWNSPPSISWFTRWMYRGPIVINATGALVISRLIEQRVKNISATFNPDLAIHRLPSIVDTHRFGAGPSDGRVPRVTEWFVWCGGEDWFRDVLLIVRVVAAARQRGYRLRVRILGSFSEGSRDSIARNAVAAGVPSEDICFAGYVDDRTLEASYRTAAALLLPLRDDDRSRTRLPNKLGEYLASGRPVITCKVGDLMDFLVHRVNAYLVEPGDERDFAEQMISVVQDPELAARIGAAGQETSKTHLDYRVHATALGRWFVECMGDAR